MPPMYCIPSIDLMHASVRPLFKFWFGPRPPKVKIESTSFSCGICLDYLLKPKTAAHSTYNYGD
jgi:hypothetical protein